MAPNDAIVILNFVVSCYDMKKTDEAIQQLQHVKELVLKNSCDVNDEVTLLEFGANCRKYGSYKFVVIVLTIVGEVS